MSDAIMSRETDIAERGLLLPARRADTPALTQGSPWIRFLHRQAHIGAQ